MLLDDRIVVALQEPVFLSRFAARFVRTDGCWLWTGIIEASGYGVLNLTKTSGYGSALAHRIAWALVNGRIPNGMCVLHRCDVPRCVNPCHLFIGTQTENVRDMDAKGRRRLPPRDGFARTRISLSKHPAIFEARASGETLPKIAARYGVTPSCISHITSRHAERYKRAKAVGVRSIVGL